MPTRSYSRPRRIQASDGVSEFDCGQPELDEWLRRYALNNQKSGMSSVFVSIAEERVAGYYALSTGGVEPDDVPSRVRKGVPRHAVPVLLLARLAVDKAFQGTGLGKALVMDALRRVDTVATEVGVRALLIHSKDSAARDFYMHLAEFEPSPVDDLQLFLLMKDLRKALNP